MAAFSVVSGWTVVQAFQSLGWTVARQRGSHIVRTKPGDLTTLVVPDHHEVARGMLRAPIRAANLTVDWFVAALP